MKKIILFFSFLLLGIGFLSIPSFGVSEEVQKLYQIKNSLIDGNSDTTYVGAVGEIIGTTDSNEGYDIFRKLKDRVFLNSQDSYLTDSTYSEHWIRGEFGNQNVMINTNYADGLNDFYNPNTLPPYLATSVLPITTPCKLSGMKTDGISFEGTTDVNGALLGKGINMVSLPNKNNSTFQFDLFIEDIQKFGTPQRLEITNYNNSGGIIINSLCTQTTTGDCKNGKNSFSIPLHSFIDSLSFDESELKHFEIYSDKISTSTQSKVVIDNFKISVLPAILNTSFPKSILSYDCSIFKTTDTNPLFVSFYRNGDESINGGFTILKLVSSGSIKDINYLGNSKKGESFVRPVQGGSYTYGIYNQQDRSNLFLSGGGLKSDEVKILSYSGLAIGSYDVLLSNINLFGFQSSEVKVGTIQIIPPITGIEFDVLRVRNPVNSQAFLFDQDVAYVNFDKDVNVELHNPNNQKYRVISKNPVLIENQKFIFPSLSNGIHPIQIEILDDAGNVLEVRNKVIVVDTIPPIFSQVKLNYTDFGGKKSPDNTLGMLFYQGLTHVNDNLIGISNKVPFIGKLTDNSGEEGLKVQYSFDNVSFYDSFDLVFGGITKFNANHIGGQGQTNIYLRALDRVGNVSDVTKIIYRYNSLVSQPIVKTNAGKKIYTALDTITLELELDDDVLSFLVNGKKYDDFIPGENVKITLPLNSVGENNFQFTVYDILHNSSTTNFVIDKTSNNSSIVGTGETLYIKGTVKADSVDLDRITSDGSPGVIIGD